MSGSTSPPPSYGNNQPSVSGPANVGDLGYTIPVQGGSPLTVDITSSNPFTQATLPYAGAPTTDPQTGAISYGSNYSNFSQTPYGSEYANGIPSSFLTGLNLSTPLGQDTLAAEIATDTAGQTPLSSTALQSAIGTNLPLSNFSGNIPSVTSGDYTTSGGYLVPDVSESALLGQEANTQLAASNGGIAPWEALLFPAAIGGGLAGLTDIGALTAGDAAASAASTAGDLSSLAGIPGLPADFGAGLQGAGAAAELGAGVDPTLALSGLSGIPGLDTSFSVPFTLGGDAASAGGDVAASGGGLSAFPETADTITVDPTALSGAETGFTPAVTGTPDLTTLATTPAAVDPSVADIGVGVPGATSAPAAAAGGGGGGWFSSLNSTLGPIVNSPVAKTLGLLGSVAGVGSSLLKANEANPIPGESNISNLAGSLAAQGTTLSNYLNTGTLPTGVQAGLNQATQSAIAATKGQYASMGLSGSTMEQQAINEIQQNAITQTGSIEQGLLSTGANLSGMAGQLYNSLVSTNTALNTQTMQALGNLASALGSSTGRTTIVNSGATAS